jgi:hypothetical protein
MASAPIMSRPFEPALRGYHAVYRESETNHCPGCGRKQWLIGRKMAECAFCATALPLAEATRQPEPKPVVWSRGEGHGKVS